MEQESKPLRGQPPIDPDRKKQRRNYTLSPDLLDRLDRIIPKTKQSAFMEQAATYMLDVLEGIRRLDDGSNDVKKNFRK